MEGKLLATVFTNPHWGGGISAALAYYAATGVFKPSEEPKEHREFYGPTILVTQKDAAEFKAKYMDETPKYDWKDFWSPTKGQIKYSG
jgi:ribose transport system substrate-binding protein